MNDLWFLSQLRLIALLESGLKYHNESDFKYHNDIAEVASLKSQLEMGWALLTLSRSLMQRSELRTQNFLQIQEGFNTT